MKKKIIELGKSIGLKLDVNVIHSEFDIWEYIVENKGKIIGAYTYYTGTTNTGVKYPAECFLSKLRNDLVATI